MISRHLWLRSTYSCALHEHLPIENSVLQTPSETYKKRRVLQNPRSNLLYASTMGGLSLTSLDCVILVIIPSWLIYLSQRRSAKHPPGPKGYPILGNVFDMMVSEIWVMAWEWGRTYDISFAYSTCFRIKLINKSQGT